MFTSCTEELYDEAIATQFKITSQKIPLQEVVSEINTVQIQIFAKNNARPEFTAEKQQKTKENNTNFIKIIKKDDYTTYSLLLNNYSKEKPFFSFLIITKKETVEKAGIAKFTPTNPIAVFDEKTFTGTFQIFDIYHTVIVQTQFTNGVAQNGRKTSKNTAKSNSCTTNVTTIVHNCTNGGNHAPGVKCGDNLINDGYYEFLITTTCNSAPAINYISAPDAFAGQSATSGSGNSLSFNNEVLSFLYQLTEEEYAVVVANPLLVKYLEQYNVSVESREFAYRVIYSVIYNKENMNFFNETIQYQIDQNWSQESADFAQEMRIRKFDNPTVFNSITPFLIEKNIDDALLDPCSKDVFQKIKNTTNCDFANVFAKLGADNSIYNTTIKTEHNSVMVNGQLQQVTTPANTGRTTLGTKYNYTMYVNPDYNGKSKLFIAALLLHEMAHAYFFSLVDDYNMGATNSFNELPILFNAAVVNQFPIGPDLHHEEIANSYVNAIAAALQEFQPGFPQQVYDDLAWGGLYGTSIFDTLLPVGNPNRERIINRYACEQTGNPQGLGTTNQQNPMGQPCN
ncbi:hypothetical protein EKL98_02175 [Flavobacterium bomense]|uniref:Uncharacterized protein n=1 Tax=Flavobacterium bomense TaxID=2497483 RepID=A0A432CR33_9FLAO|nr:MULTISPECIES: hypothetical protein [Flavobacterium]RTZ08146.1 hypothetical protein EKL98_02175 [Flavobacterium bomense]RTZ09298.1 hypothetical protein EKM03_01545 [Flavobacterium sp. GSP6]